MSECGSLIVDLKTTMDASPDAFARTAANFNYPLQAAYYVDGLQAAGIASPDAVTSFVFLVVEKTPPYGVAVYTLPEDAIEPRSQPVPECALDLRGRCRHEHLGWILCRLPD